MNESEERKLESELHNEFQLERVILFSDAVFAIAITLMVIELKFPDIPKDITTAGFWLAIKPLTKNFVAFVVSFIFIGMYWYRHLKLCGLLEDYNRVFISLNLLFLFFIVLFPFSVSTMTHLSNDHYLFAALIYFSNIFFTTLTHFILYIYLLGKGRNICRAVSVNEKKILIEESLVPIIVIVIILAAFFVSRIMFQDNLTYALYVYSAAAVIVFLFRKQFRIRHKNLRAEIISAPNNG